MRNKKRKRLVFVLLSVLAVLLVIGGVIAVHSTTASRQANRAPRPTIAPTSTAHGSVSPLLFGTNMGLFTANDQVITSETTRSLMQQIHVRMVRIPLRRSLPNALFVQAE